MALQNQADIIREVLVRLNTSTTTSFYTDSMLSGWVSQANTWAASLYKWPYTEMRYSTTYASLGTNEDGYTTLEYPENFKTDTVRHLTIGGKRLEKKNFYKFAAFIEDNPADTSKIYTDFARRVYINPNAGMSGTVTAWGQYNVTPLDETGSSQNTIFTGISDEGNLALVEEVLSYAKAREKAPEGQQGSVSAFHHTKAEKILERLWNSIAEEQSLYQDTQNDGMFKRFDVVDGGYSDDAFRRDQF